MIKAVRYLLLQVYLVMYRTLVSSFKYVGEVFFRYSGDNSYGSVEYLFGLTGDAMYLGEIKKEDFINIVSKVRTQEGDWFCASRSRKVLQKLIENYDKKRN